MKRRCIGNVNASKFAQTTMAKSVLDAGWSAFRDMLCYKARLRGGGACLEVSEHLSTQTCSECGGLPASRPRGIAGLRERVWRCDDCGAEHDRDVNAAINLKNMAVSSTVSACGEEGSGPARKRQAKPASLKQEVSFDHVCA